jgi:hypothetical protein
VQKEGVPCCLLLDPERDQKGEIENKKSHSCNNNLIVGLTYAKPGSLSSQQALSVIRTDTTIYCKTHQTHTHTPNVKER